MQIIIDITPDFVPEEGDALDAVTAALEHFEIPASLVTSRIDATAAVRLVEALANLANIDTSPLGVSHARISELRQKAQSLVA